MDRQDYLPEHFSLGALDDRLPEHFSLGALDDRLPEHEDVATDDVTSSEVPKPVWVPQDV